MYCLYKYSLQALVGALVPLPNVPRQSTAHLQPQQGSAISGCHGGC